MNLALERTNVAERVDNVLGTLAPQLDARKVTARLEVDAALKALVYLTDGHRIEQVRRRLLLTEGGIVMQFCSRVNCMLSLSGQEPRHWEMGGYTAYTGSWVK